MKEQLVIETISRHTKDKEVIVRSQHGFTKAKSCLTNLIRFCNEITVLVNAGRAVDIMYLYFSKAFSKVSPNFLVEKMMRYGLGKQTVRRTENWLNSQAHSVMASSKKTSWRPVPQWSILCEILFNIFFNNLDDGVSILLMIQNVEE